ncbi:MAG: hypothetical protein HND44_14735 [Chloroflexi bacterium]|nr:hypothetical protein [Chloroflexota bacterium]NOG35801.1 hypothetical protein [Chloroflexota bacterium]GIK57897.1 MAG: hypothetical protein BroJett015_35600 [Chloroflexota bacterium]
MIQPRIQTAEYWGPGFTLAEADIEQIYNHFLEVERPQTAIDLAQVIIRFRVANEHLRIKKLLSGRAVYQPKNNYAIGDELVFPALQFVSGTITAVRDGRNPQLGPFQVIGVTIDGKERQFAAALKTDHVLNASDGDTLTSLVDVDVEQVIAAHGEAIAAKLGAELSKRAEFMQLGQQWFVKGLMAEVNIGHLHLAEAVLEMFDGGPLGTEQIVPHLDMDAGVRQEVLIFSLNYALLQDGRFDEVAPRGKVAWFLRRLEPEGVQQIPDRLRYDPIPYDRALISPQLILLERELDDEWSEVESPQKKQLVVFTLLFPHRLLGTIPLSSCIRPLFPASNSARQRVLLVDDETNEEIQAWVVRDGRYVFGLADWYNKNEIPIGGFVHLQPGPEPGVLSLGYDRRRPQREWVRLATAVDHRIQFELKRRAVGCGYDDLMIVGTDTIAAIDALWRRAESQQRTVASLLAEIFPQLAQLTPQNTVHAKTLYSALNMIRRVPPGPLFAELVRHPAFQPVGDHYWQFDKSRWQES